MMQVGTGHGVFAGEGQRRGALQRRVAACRVVVGVEVAKLPFQVPGIPEQHIAEEFSPHGVAKARGGVWRFPPLPAETASPMPLSWQLSAGLTNRSVPDHLQLLLLQS